MLESNERAGYPHDGGLHSLIIFNVSDAKSFVDFVEDEYGTHPGCKEFVEFARDRIFVQEGVHFIKSLFGVGSANLDKTFPGLPIMV